MSASQDPEFMSLKDEVKQIQQLISISLMVVIIVIVYRMGCKKDNFDGLDYGTDMTAPINDYDIMNRNAAISRPTATDLTAKIQSQRMDWMKNRFDNAVTDNTNGAGMSADSVTSPGAIGTSTGNPVTAALPQRDMPSCYVSAGPKYFRNDPREVVGQSNYEWSRTPIGSTPEMQDLIQYGNSM